MIRGRRKRAVDSPTTLTVLRPYVKQQWPPLLIAAIATLVIAAADVASPLPLAYLIDHVLTVGGKGTEVDLSDFSRSDYFTIGYVGLAVLGIAAAEAIATYQSDLRLELAGERIIHELRLAIYSQLQRLSISFHARLQTGDLVTRVTGDVNAIGDIFAGSLGALVSSFLIFLLMLGASLYIDPVLALCAFAVTPVLALLSFWFRKRARVSSRQMRSREGEIASISGEVLGAIREVQAFGSEEYERARLEAKSAERWHAGIRASRLEGRFAGMIDFASEIGIALVLVVGAYPRSQRRSQAGPADGHGHVCGEGLPSAQRNRAPGEPDLEGARAGRSRGRDPRGRRRARRPSERLQRTPRHRRDPA